MGADKTYPGGVRALDDLTLDLPAGCLTAVIGPSGCGKTTLLKVVAGLEALDAGDIIVGDRSVLGLPPSQRPTAMVFQTNTLFPDLTVRQNVALALRGTHAQEAIDVALLRFGLTGVQHRHPDALSGGQLRRAAIARALVLSPEVLLLDEPFSGLDDVLRARLARTVRDAQRRLGTTTVFVTHDQGEALSLADLVVVMREGTIEQVGSPEEVYQRPASVFVASFVGRANLVDVVVGRVREEAAGRQGDVSVLGVREWFPAHRLVRVGAAKLLVRPEAVRLTARRSLREWTEVAGDVGLITDALYYGSRVDYVVETEQGTVTAVSAPAEPMLGVGDGVHLEIDPSQGWLLPGR